MPSSPSPPCRSLAPANARPDCTSGFQLPGTLANGKATLSPGNPKAFISSTGSDKKKPCVATCKMLGPCTCFMALSVACILVSTLASFRISPTACTSSPIPAEVVKCSKSRGEDPPLPGGALTLLSASEACDASKNGLPIITGPCLLGEGVCKRNKSRPLVRYVNEKFSI